jgi:hypothetical protein
VRMKRLLLDSHTLALKLPLPSSERRESEHVARDCGLLSSLAIASGGLAEEA